MTVQRVKFPTKEGWWLKLNVENGRAIRPQLIYAGYNGNNKILVSFKENYVTSLPEGDNYSYIGPIIIKDIKSVAYPL